MRIAELLSLTAAFAAGAALAFWAGRRRVRALQDALAGERRKSAELKDALHKDFLANVSHELRTPLAAIKGYAESLRLGALGNKRTALQFVRTIERHAQRLSILVESILDVSALTPKPKELQLAPFLWSVVETVEQRASRRKLAIRVKAEPEVWARADFSHLSQALLCLLDNAIQYNREGGSIEVEAARGEGGAVIVVRDTGQGIPAEDVPNIFERFAQRSRSRPSVGGSGIGLSMARSLIEANGGSVTLRSTGPEGTALELTLPAGRPAQTAVTAG